MRATAILVLVVFGVGLAAYGQDGGCGLVNGSFEDDEVINNIALQEPNGWTVEVPSPKFRGYVRYDWLTDGRYNLTIYSDWFMDFNAGETATVSQPVQLADVNEIVFDLKLETYVDIWDPNIAKPVLMIDGQVVWELDGDTADLRGEYLHQRYVVDDKFRDGQVHTLALGLRIDAGGILWERYITQWDAVQCRLYCNGGGLLAADVNKDCYVDMQDLSRLAELWLAEVGFEDRANLSAVGDVAGHGWVNFFDFAVYAAGWVGDMADLAGFAERWLTEVGLDDPYNVYTADDVQSAGVVDFHDFAVLADSWLASSYPQGQQDQQ